MSCKYLCQVGALEYVSTCSDRCEFPVGAGMIERFWGSGLLPLALPWPGHQHCARALPPLPLRDPVIESAKRGVYFGCTSERGRWREKERKADRHEGKRRQIKDRGREEHQSHFSTGDNHFFSVLIYALMLLQIHSRQEAKKHLQT